VFERIPADKRPNVAAHYAAQPFGKSQTSDGERGAGFIALRAREDVVPAAAFTLPALARVDVIAGHQFHRHERAVPEAPTALPGVLSIEFAHLSFSFRSCPQREHVTSPFAAMMSDTFTFTSSARHFGHRS
jgi:hypothetical protein